LNFDGFTPYEAGNSVFGCRSKIQGIRFLIFFKKKLWIKDKEVCISFHECNEGNGFRGLGWKELNRNIWFEKRGFSLVT